jgi:mRNA-degrading endonuclease RelE of RelBE toxin-antitoxin system
MAIVTILPEAPEQIEALPKVIYERVEALILRLERWPAVSGAKRLSGDLAGHYCLRTGDYRIQFRVLPSETGQGKPSPDDEIIVEKAGHRDGFYE